MLIARHLQASRIATRLPIPTWAGQSGSRWSLSGSVASGASGNAAGTEVILGTALPAADCYFDITIDLGYASYVNFLGVAKDWVVGTSYDYASSGYTAWYWSGLWFRSGSSFSNGIALVAGTYRFAVNRANGRLYAAGTSPSTATTYEDLPTGWSSGTLRPLAMPQGGYDSAHTITIAGAGFGSGGLF